MNSCLACERIQDIKRNSNPYFVKELNTGYFVLFDYQEYTGYSLLIHKNHIGDIHELSEKEQSEFFVMQLI